MEVVTGYVQSDILRDGFVAPKDSLYLDVKEKLEGMKINGNETGMPARKYADSIVERLLRKTRPMEIWQGALSRRIRFGLFLPLWLLVRVNTM